MKRAIVKLRSIENSPYSQSKHINVPKKEKESAEDYEMRTWRERIHRTDDGFVKIPGTQFSQCIKEAAKFLSIGIPGKGKSTYTKHFDAGIMVLEDLVLPVKVKDVESEDHFVPSDGRSGGTTRVNKRFLFLPKWEGKVEFLIVDDTITKDVFEYHLKNAGILIGVGRFRPRKKGTYGRFEILGIKWEDFDE